MKKFLIIASSMLFISSAVFGRNRGFVQTEEFPTTTQLNSVVEVSSMKKEYSGPLDSTNKSEILTTMKNKCHELLLTAQSELKNNNWLSKDAKLLYSKLNFDDIWKQIELVLASVELNREKKKYFDVRKVVTDNAKNFYKQVLGDSELGKVLYEKAEEVIDSAECIQCSDLMSIRQSFCMDGGGITCRYYSANDFLLTLVHETGHALEDFYRDIKNLPRPTEQQREYGSTFFETLLEASNFRGKLYSQDFSLHGLRIGEIYLDLLKKNLIGEISSVYDKDTLLKLYQLFKEDSSSDTTEQEKRVELDKVVDDLENNPKTKLFIDVIRDLNGMGISLGPNYIDNWKWEKCLRSLDKVQGYDDLKQFLHDANIGKGPYFDAVRGDGKNSGYCFKLFFGNKEIKKIDSPYELKGVEWPSVFWLAGGKIWNFKAGFEEAVVAAHVVGNLNSRGVWRFLGNSTSQRLLLGFGRIVSHFGILSKERLSFLENLVNGMWSLQNLDNHTEGKYNAFRLVKDKGYLDLLENGGSLPIEEVMAELTKASNSLKLTEKSAGEFLNFLGK